MASSQVEQRTLGSLAAFFDFAPPTGALVLALEAIAIHNQSYFKVTMSERTGESVLWSRARLDSLLLLMEARM